MVLSEIIKLGRRVNLDDSQGIAAVYDLVPEHFQVDYFKPSAHRGNNGCFRLTVEFLANSPSAQEIFNRLLRDYEGNTDISSLSTFRWDTPEDFSRVSSFKGIPGRVLVYRVLAEPQFKLNRTHASYFQAEDESILGKLMDHSKIPVSHSNFTATYRGKEVYIDYSNRFHHPGDKLASALGFSRAGIWLTEEEISRLRSTRSGGSLRLHSSCKTSLQERLLGRILFPGSKKLYTIPLEKLGPLTIVLGRVLEPRIMKSYSPLNRWKGHHVTDFKTCIDSIFEDEELDLGSMSDSAALKVLTSELDHLIKSARKARYSGKHLDPAHGRLSVQLSEDIFGVDFVRGHSRLFSFNTPRQGLPFATFADVRKKLSERELEVIGPFEIHIQDERDINLSLLLAARDRLSRDPTKAIKKIKSQYNAKAKSSRSIESAIINDEPIRPPHFPPGATTTKVDFSSNDGHNNVTLLNLGSESTTSNRYHLHLDINLLDPQLVSLQERVIQEFNLAA